MITRALARLLDDPGLADQARRRLARARTLELMRRYRFNGPWAQQRPHYIIVVPCGAWS
jgi:hypothetical protein